MCRPRPTKGKTLEVGHRHVVEKTPPMPFPKITIKQTIVREMVKNSHRDLSLRVREVIRDKVSRIKPEHYSKVKDLLPSVILLKTDKNIGTPICEGYKVLYKSQRLVGRPRWIRELIYSPNSTPHSCLGKLSNLLERIK